jgi:branched-chain amino acid transport system substrate-binding protein
MRRFLVLAAALATTAALLAPAPVAAGGGNEPVKLGVLAILSGPIGEVGQDAIRGAELAVERINDGGGVLGGRDLELVVADDQADPAVAVQAATRLVQEDDVSVILGPISSGPAIAVSQVATRNRVPMVAFNAGARELTESDSEFVFRTYPIIQDAYSALAEYAVDGLGYKKIGYLGWNETAGQAALEGFEEGLKKTDGTLAGDELAAITAPELSSEIGRLRAENPDAVAIAAPLPLGGNAVRQIRESGWDVPLLGWVGWYTSGFAPFTGSASDGMVMASAFHPEAVTSRVGQNFLESFEAAHGRQARDIEAVGYDAVNIAAAGIKKAKSSDPAKIAEALHETRVRGVKQPFRWTASGDIRGGHPVVIIEWQGGQQQLIESKP